MFLIKKEYSNSADFIKDFVVFDEDSVNDVINAEYGSERIPSVEEGVSVDRNATTPDRASDVSVAEDCLEGLVDTPEDVHDDLSLGDDVTLAEELDLKPDISGGVLVFQKDEDDNNDSELSATESHEDWCLLTK